MSELGPHRKMSGSVTLSCLICVGKAMCEGSKWYFYSRRTQSRVTGSGYWQPMGIEEPIYSNGKKVGIKKCSAFYLGQQPSDQGVKTSWIMQEYGLPDSTSSSRSSSRRRSSKIVSRYISFDVASVFIPAFFVREPNFPLESAGNAP